MPMAAPFSNTKLRVPPGFQNALEGLSREVLRSQPENIYEFATQYFSDLLKKRAETGIDDIVALGAKLEDRYYNIHSFKDTVDPNNVEQQDAAVKIQSEYRRVAAQKEMVSRKEEQAATVIQASFRGYQDRCRVSELKKSISLGSAEGFKAVGEDENEEKEKVIMEEDDPEVINHAATTIQAAFKGFHVRKTLHRERSGGESGRESHNSNQSPVNISSPRSNNDGSRKSTPKQQHSPRTAENTSLSGAARGLDADDVVPQTSTPLPHDAEGVEAEQDDAKDTDRQASFVEENEKNVEVKEEADDELDGIGTGRSLDGGEIVETGRSLDGGEIVETERSLDGGEIVETEDKNEEIDEAADQNVEENEEEGLGGGGAEDAAGELPVVNQDEGNAEEEDVVTVDEGTNDADEAPELPGDSIDENQNSNNNDEDVVVIDEDEEKEKEKEEEQEEEQEENVVEGGGGGEGGEEDEEKENDVEGGENGGENKEEGKEKEEEEGGIEEPGADAGQVDADEEE